ncbi:MAG: Hsp20/alpha crystallin family protein [Verrucomicrobiota bacterium]
MTTETSPQETTTFRRPRYEVDRKDDGFVLRVALPGVSKDNVQVSLQGNRLEVEGQRQGTLPQDGSRAILRELRHDHYRLRLDLKADIDGEGIEAKVDQGLIELSLPKAKRSDPQRIEVQ